MSGGWNTVQQVDTLRSMASDLGFEIGRDPHGSTSGVVCLFVSKDESVLPVYNRNMPLFTGDIDGCINFLIGWRKCVEYHNVLGFEKRRKVAEDKHYTDLQFRKIKHAVTTGKEPTKDMGFEDGQHY
jgi:hypothetical protein